MNDKRCTLGYEDGSGRVCPETDKCSRCGWNPQEAALRKWKIHKIGLEKMKSGLYGIVVRK